MLTRFLPFLFAGKLQRFSHHSTFQNIVPTLLMGLLVIYCFKDFTFNKEYYLRLVSALLVLGLQAKWNNFIISILGGTIFYVLFINMVNI